MVKKLMFESNAGERGFQGLWNKLFSMFNIGKEEVVRSSKVSKARLDLSSLKKERERVFERLGEEIYKRCKERTVSIPGLDSFFAEIDIINLKLSSKERELKGLKGEEVDLLRSKPSDAGIKQERRERPYRPKKKGPYPSKEVQQEVVSVAEGIKAERPGKRHYRPRRRPTEVKQDVDIT